LPAGGFAAARLSTAAGPLRNHAGFMTIGGTGGTIVKANKMDFRIASFPGRNLAGADQCFLISDSWDDFSYKTTFQLVYFDGAGERHDIGGVKIMQRGMTHGRVPIDQEFEALGDDYASLGQDQSYYENLISLEDAPRVDILTGIKDAVWDEDRYTNFRREGAFQTSLLRSVTQREIKKFRAIIHEQADLTPFHFEYTFPDENQTQIEFEVTPRALPPTNIHVIVGRNGVGKTRLLRNLSTLLREGRGRRLGRLTFFADEGETSGEEGFANLIVVAFSAFDEFAPATNEGTRTGIQYTYIGLRKNVRLKDGTRVTRNKTDPDLRKDFVQSTLACLRSARRPRWRNAMRVLENDPGFAALRLERLADLPQEDFEVEAGNLFDASSSGHKIVLLTMTRLVELVSERTLILIDEPEAHLHPPLAASFIRALSDLLVHRNGVAILATHSPVIVQEVPRDCVSLFFRTGDNVEIERPEIETFAENVGLLTREIFRVELTESGYHAMITASVERSDSVDDAIELFDGKLGAEGRALVRSIWRGDDA
jgi:ABC-type transport system involved in cytochrome c biogenesis ATPase subunit